MPGGIPKADIVNEWGKPIMSRDERFNHPWMSSRCLFLFDNETCDDIGKCGNVPGEPANPSTPAEFGPNRITLYQRFPVLPL